MIASLFLLATSATDLGTSPLVQPDHVHRWTISQSDNEVTAWIDKAWLSEDVIDGIRYKLVLLRTEMNAKPYSVVTDLVAAVDCHSNEIGMLRGWLIRSSGGNGSLELVIDRLEMQPALPNPEDGDQKIIAFACSARQG